MSSIRVSRPRAFRPYLSTRYQCLRRAESSASQTKEAASHKIPPPPPPPNPSFFARNRAPILFGNLTLVLGLLVGSTVINTFAPPPLPQPGTTEDDKLIADLNRRIDEVFKVKVLRGKCLGVARQLKGEEGGWVEIVSSPATEDTTRVQTAVGNSLLSHIQGARGLGAQRIFWNRREHQLVAVVWFGPALSGWPGVTHGGVIATEFSEKLALTESLAEDHSGGSDNVVSAAAVPQRLPGTGNHAKMFAPINRPDEPAQLSLSYVKPTLANNFYVIRISPALPALDQDPAHIVPEETAGGHEYEATLETLDARITAKAKARFAPSSRLQRVEDEVVKAATSTYTELKQWLWPSRQQQSSPTS